MLAHAGAGSGGKHERISRKGDCNNSRRKSGRDGPYTRSRSASRPLMPSITTLVIHSPSHQGGRRLLRAPPVAQYVINHADLAAHLKNPAPGHLLHMRNHALVQSLAGSYGEHIALDSHRDALIAARYFIREKMQKAARWIASKEGKVRHGLSRRVRFSLRSYPPDTRACYSSACR